MSRLLVAAAALAAIAVFAPAARADYTPPRQPEPTCTLEKARASNETCRACDADFLDSDVCTRTLASQGLTRLCRGRGVTGWTEVWCGAGQSPDAGASTPATGSNCAFAPGSDPDASAVASLALGLLLLLAQRERRARPRSG